MDFPQFFRTALNDLRIKSDRWRGLAVLTKAPSTTVSLRGGAFEDNVQATTGSAFTDRDVSLHVSSKPNKVKKTASTSGGTALAAVPGVRYLIHAIQGSVRLIAANTTTVCYIGGTIDGVATEFFSIHTVPLAAGAYLGSVTCDILTDVNTAVVVYADASPDAGVWILHYSIVGAS